VTRYQKSGIALIVCVALSLIQYFVLLHFGIFWFIVIMILMTPVAKNLASWVLSADNVSPKTNDLLSEGDSTQHRTPPHSVPKKKQNRNSVNFEFRGKPRL
jgi:hypothetical protein